MPDQRLNNEDYILKYYPVQAFMVWPQTATVTAEDKERTDFQNFAGWKPFNSSKTNGSYTGSYNAAWILNESGDLEIISAFNIPDEAKTQMISAQPGTYAVVQYISESENYLIGYISKDHIPILDIRGKGRELFTITKDKDGNTKVRVCRDCTHEFTSYEPNFCVKCGSKKFKTGGYPNKSEMIEMNQYFLKEV